MLILASTFYGADHACEIFGHDNALSNNIANYSDYEISIHAYNYGIYRYVQSF